VPLCRCVPPAAIRSRAVGQRQESVACRCCPAGASRSRRRHRYPSDMSDAEWAVCEPLLPHPAWLAGKGGRPSAYCMRDVVDGIRYLTHNGPVWRALPADFPPAWTVYYRAGKWQADGSTQTMHDQLRDQVRQVACRKPAPTAAIIDSQSVKAAEEVARSSRGYDAGKKVNGRKRHIAVDTIGLLLTIPITAASVQDRDAAKPLLWNLRKAFPGLQLAWADGGYAGKLVTWAKTALKLTLQIVKRPDDLHTFQVLPRRWVVERSLCAARRFAVFPVQPGGTRREVPGSNGLPGSERLRGQQHARKPGGGVQWSGTACRGDPRDMAKAGLPESQSPVDASSHPPERLLKPVSCSASESKVAGAPPERGATPSEGVQGDEWGAYVTLTRTAKTNAGSPAGREPQGDGGLVVVGAP